MSTVDEIGARSLLVDGSIVVLREIGPADADAMRELHRHLPPEDRYRRFFTLCAVNADQYVDSVTSDNPGNAGIGAFAGADLLGVASYATLSDSTTAEFALVVAHERHVHGIGTLLIEELVSLARRRGLTRLKAEILTENAPMLRLIDELGLPRTQQRTDDEIEVLIPLAPTREYDLAVHRREQVADRASLSAVLRPDCVAVIGAGRAPDSIGHALLANIVEGGYTGSLYAVNPHAREVAGVPSHPRVSDVPVVPDLAVLCVPARAVAGTARECGELGVRALLVVTAGLSADDSATLRATAREFGMRLVGPNCIGVYNGDPAVRLNATFARNRVQAGSVGVVTQSGGVAIALFSALDQVGLGVSTLVSTGDKYDVSGNDLLLWWSGEPETKAAVLYLESFGNPRKFSSLCRRLSRTKPILAVRPPATPVAQRAASSHTAALATPAVTADALYRQAGVIAVDRLSELPETLAALVDQPLPAGRRVAVISNAGGAGVIAADALGRQGLVLPTLPARVAEALRAHLPAQASLANPLDTSAVVSAEVFQRCVESLLAEPSIDAVVAIAAPTALGDPIEAIAACGPAAARAGTPLLAVHLGQSAAVTRLGTVPCYGDAVAAAGALNRCVQRREWLDRPEADPREPEGLDTAAATGIVREFLASSPDGGWLDPERCLRVLDAVGVPTAPGVLVDSPDAAVAAASRVGRPVALKAVADGLLHKSSGGGIVLGAVGEHAVRAAYATFAERFGGALRGVFVQPMIDTDGVELLVGVKGDPMFGPLVVFGLGGTSTDTVADRTARLTPVSDADLDEMLHGLRGSRALFSHVDEAEVRDVVARVGWLAQAIPEIAELDVNPLIATEHGCVAVDARIRLAPVPVYDPLLRHLRM
ncbi:Acyl-CoA synthetase (NDP forming) [Actinokineospora alba]|uniref:Acyl-CoA synthetase (NDP forming) n=1 Tax=Actinokineospora alba TaxID=504798 RepID=A0A1H0FPW4_9PSEU|nr:bifunctional GNAT family N-acetyltransferase/acetate--CoA ligase family protein [Actinokineospora alba]TDP69560.1 acyl-CoA synthetase (NDP forming) [Actinokineospora alba]SDI14132.1 Acyl-CoA synthetase (NDP forming) [Actinokineospora alba]SDN96519.1 Acyl-CoA synthetase (NDP forming) [Actinokineospora alba]